VSRERFDTRLDPEYRENLELVKRVHGVSMSKFVRFALDLAFDRIGIKKADIEKILKK
jgi:hypothetical protein